MHGLLVTLRDPEQAAIVREELRRELGPGFALSIWTEANPEMLTALAVEKNVMFYLLTFIVIVAAFGIMNSQITFVVQKTREIGMMKALGATRGQIMSQFLEQPNGGDQQRVVGERAEKLRCHDRVKTARHFLKGHLSLHRDHAHPRMRLLRCIHRLAMVGDSGWL